MVSTVIKVKLSKVFRGLVAISTVYKNPVVTFSVVGQLVALALKLLDSVVQVLHKPRVVAVNLMYLHPRILNFHVLWQLIKYVGFALSMVGRPVFVTPFMTLAKVHVGLLCYLIVHANVIWTVGEVPLAIVRGLAAYGVAIENALVIAVVAESGVKIRLHLLMRVLALLF